MTIVTMPDGTDVSFPDDMPPQAIKTLIATKFPDAVKAATAPAQNNPIGAITDIPSEMVNTAKGHLSNIANMYGGTAENGVMGQTLNVGKGLGSILGIIPDTLLGAPARSIGGHLLAGAEHAIGSVIAPETAAQDNPNEMYQTAKGNIDTAMMGFGARGGVPGLRTGPIQPPPSVIAADRLSKTGAEVTIPKYAATDSVIPQQAAAIAKNIPLVGKPIVNAGTKSVEQLGAKVDEIASGFGGASVEGAGTTARTAIGDWIGPESKAKIKGLYDKVDNLVDPVITTDLANTRAVADSIVSRRSNATLKGNGSAVDLALDAATKPGGLNYAGIKDLRTNVGELLDRGILPEGFSGKELKAIYKGLSEDLRAAAANAGGPQASAVFERANKYNALVQDRREALTKIIGASGDDAPEKVFQRIAGMASSKSTADITRLAQARKVMEPSEWNDVASAVVSKLGLTNKGEFSPAKFLSDWGNLSDAGKSVLFRSGTGKSSLAKSLDDIATISERWQDISRFTNTSRTGQDVWAASLGAAAYASPLHTIASAIGGGAVALALSRPATAASIAQFSRKYQMAAASPSASTVAGLTLAARNLANSLRDVSGNVSGTDFLRAIQSPATVGAESDQTQVPGTPGD